MKGGGGGGGGGGGFGGGGSIKRQALVTPGYNGIFSSPQPKTLGVSYSIGWLYICVVLVHPHFQMTSPLKPLGQFNCN